MGADWDLLKRLEMTLKARITVGFFLAALCAVWSADSQAGSTFKDWEFAIGPGIAARPEYVGSEQYEPWPLPIIEVKWKDRFFLSAEDGVGWNLVKTRNFRAGPLGHYYWGSDNRPTGISSIDFGTQIGGFAEFAFDHWKLDATGLYSVSGSSEGLRINAGASFGTRVNKDLTVVLRGDLTFFNDNEMKTYFGVNSREASDSIYSEYSPSMGVADVGVGLKINYQFSKSWSGLGILKASYLIGDAADSPLVEQEVQGYGGFGVAYHF